MQAKQVIYGMAEIIAAHNLLRYVRKNDHNERLRMAAGATMAGLGYVFGPKLETYLQHDNVFNKKIKQNIIYAAGGAILGSFVGYKAGAVLGNKHIEQQPLTPIEEIVSAVDIARADAEPERPGGLLTIASVGWLGYSLFYDGKTSDERKQHLWGLGAGVIGYVYGPELLDKISVLKLSQKSVDDALAVYKTGGATIGGVAGGLLGWYKGKSFIEKTVPRMNAPSRG